MQLSLLSQQKLTRLKELNTNFDNFRSCRLTILSHNYAIHNINEKWILNLLKHIFIKNKKKLRSTTGKLFKIYILWDLLRAWAFKTFFLIISEFPYYIFFSIDFLFSFYYAAYLKFLVFSIHLRSKKTTTYTSIIFKCKP
jgi:hypothetical protein